MLRVPGPAPRGVVPKQQHGGARPRGSACGGGSARPCGRCRGAREEPGEAAPAAPVRVYPCQDGDKWSCQPARRELPEAAGSAHPAGPAAAAAPPRRARPALNFPVAPESESWEGAEQLARPWSRKRRPALRSCCLGLASWLLLRRGGRG